MSDLQCKLVEQFMYETSKTISTRDRDPSNSIPERFKVTSVENVVSQVVLSNYMSARGQNHCVPPEHHAITRQSANEILVSNGLPTLADCEELLWHGAARETARRISEEGFQARHSEHSFVGKAVYFAESITKADEYTDPEDKVALLARVRVGRPAVSTDRDPSTRQHALRHQAKQSTGCILLDREAAVGTYKEWAMMYGVQCLPCLLVSYRTCDSEEDEATARSKLLSWESARQVVKSAAKVVVVLAGSALFFVVAEGAVLGLVTVGRGLLAAKLTQPGVVAVGAAVPAMLLHQQQRDIALQAA